MNLSQLIDVASGLSHMHNMRSPIVHGDPKGVRVRVAVSLFLEMTPCIGKYPGELDAPGHAM